MKVGDLVAFDANIIKRIFPVGLFDGDVGTITSECIPADILSQGGPRPHIESPVWWVLWWTGDHAGKKVYCEEQYLRILGESGPTSDR